MTPDEFMAHIDSEAKWQLDRHGLVVEDPSCSLHGVFAALRAVAMSTKVKDKVSIGDKGVFNSGRNSMRDELLQSIGEAIK